MNSILFSYSLHILRIIAADLAIDNTKHALSPCQTKERSVLWRRSLAAAIPELASARITEFPS
jgi:hypothetical protein